MNTEKLRFEKLNYIIRYPKSFNAGKKYPLLFLFHGAGNRGNNIDDLYENPFFQITGSDEDFPFVCIAPQCHKNTWFDLFETLERFVREMVGKDFADKERVYVIGASMGGYATWQLAMSMPEYFAAIVPICAGGMYWNAPRLVNVPVWAFHGAKDTTVFPEESKKMTDAVTAAGGDARLTIYTENAHDAWSDTYNNKEVFEWLLSHKNQNTTELIDIYDDKEIYG